MVMAEEQQQEFHSIFPQPPPFWKNFTSENLERLAQYKKEAADSAGATDGGDPSEQLSASQLLELPSELRCLIPPEPPADDDEYRVFNGLTKAHATDKFQKAIEHLKFQVSGILPGWEYEQLYPSHPPDESGLSDWSHDRQQYLLRFVKSILMNFLELLSILYADPASEERDNKLKDIVNLVSNVHALVNEYRPHQARETLVHMMQDQVDRKRAEVMAVRQMKDKVAAALVEFERNAPDHAAGASPEDSATASAGDKRKETQRYMWNAMEELLGH
jgi:mediator of RNA polymerase II transcription subunit 7